MGLNLFSCPECGAKNEVGNKNCSACDKPTVIGLLKSRSGGSSPSEFCWPLYPWKQSVGSSVLNDIIVPSDRIHKIQCHFDYRADEKLYISLPEMDRRVHVGHDLVLKATPRRLIEGDVIRLGKDHLELFYHKISLEEERTLTDMERVQRKTDKANSTNPAAARLMLMLGYLQEVRSSTDVEELMSSAVDAALKITGMDRGYAFVVENTHDEMNLKEVVCRKTGEENYFEKDYTISRSLITKVLESNGSVIIEDGDTSVESTHSMRDFKIKSVVCLPLTKFDKKTRTTQLLGIIYADKMFSKTKLPAQSGTALQQLAQIVSANIIRCQEHETSLLENAQYQEYIVNLVDEIDTIKYNVALISEKLTEVKDTNEIAVYTEYLAGETEKLNEIVSSVREVLA